MGCGSKLETVVVAAAGKVVLPSDANSGLCTKSLEAFVPIGCALAMQEVTSDSKAELVPGLRRGNRSTEGCTGKRVPRA